MKYLHSDSVLESHNPGAESRFTANFVDAKKQTSKFLKCTNIINPIIIVILLRALT